MLVNEDAKRLLQGGSVSDSISGSELLGNLKDALKSVINPEELKEKLKGAISLRD